VKVDVTAPILDINNIPLTAGDGQHVTLRSIIEAVLINPLEGDNKLEGPAKLQLWDLALKVHREDEPDFQAEEIALIKRRIGIGTSTTVVGRAFALLDPKPARG
jgi:hypothetical protein